MAKKSKAKAEEWLTKRCWMELFDESIREEPDRAERIMVLMTSLRQMVKGDKEDRKNAARAIGNCVKACAPYTRTQVFAEYVEWKAKKRKSA